MQNYYNKSKLVQRRGKFIVIYGINNLGKTTQAKLLVKHLKSSGFQAEYLKNPLYNFKPTGPIINRYLRKNNPDHFSPREIQMLFALNRWQYQPVLIDKLNRGINIVAEDYLGTGIAWGIGAGVAEKFLKQINSHLFEEDLTFLFIGRRFKEAQEKNHRHETNEPLMKKVEQAHLKLSREYSWININANLTREQVQEQIWNNVIKIIS